MCADLSWNLDEEFRVIRYRRELEEYVEPEEGKFCARARKIEEEPPHWQNHEIDLYFEKLYKRIERRRKAIHNWKRLQIVFAMLRVIKSRNHDEFVKEVEEVHDFAYYRKKLSSLTI